MFKTLRVVKYFILKPPFIEVFLILRIFRSNLVFLAMVDTNLNKFGTDQCKLFLVGQINPYPEQEKY
jgi:hypothetical protein